MNLFLCAGDVSGDAHCALLMREIKARHPDWHLSVLGGAQMQALADEVVGDARGLAVIGLASTYALLPRFAILQERAKKWIARSSIDAALLCDWGAFNRRLLPHLNERGVPCGYYFPPRSWRKTGEGASSLAPRVRWFATPFEWDAERLRKTGTRAEWVGHPLLEIVAAAPQRDSARKGFGVEPERPLIALLPGSRSLELKYIAPQLAQTARLLQRTAGFEKAHFVVPTPIGVSLPRPFQGLDNVISAPGRATEALLACDAAIVKSGTATLEAAVCGAPQIVVYDGPPLLRVQYVILGGAKKLPMIAMPNIIAGQRIVPEFVGPACDPSHLLPELLSLLQGDRAREMRENYKTVRHALGADLGQGATARTVELIEELVS